jgi:cytochrome P450
MAHATRSRPSIAASARRRRAPGPAHARAATRAMTRDPLSFLTDAARDYGDVVRLPFLFGTTYLINHPDGVQQVLVDRAGNYGKEPHENNIFKRFVGISVLTAEGESWQRLRHLEQTAFHGRQMPAAGAQMIQVIDDYLREWRDEMTAGEAVDLVPIMTELAIRILGKTVFSLDLSDDTQTVAAALRVMGRYALKLFYQPLLPVLGPLAPINRQGRTAQSALDAVVFRLIRERRAQIEAQEESVPEDILTRFLLLADYEGNPALTDAQIRNETLSLLIAGHENVSSLLCWTWYLLAQHPSVAERMYQEIAVALGDRLPAFEDVAQLPYTRMVLDEALRLYPPAWSFSRRAIAADVIGGFPIPAGSAILLSPYTMHRNPAFWRDPDQFDPERFTDAARVDRPRYAYYPFGGGQHYCMGATFAMLEAPLVVAMMAQRFHLELPAGAAVRPDPLVTLRPHALPMSVQPK